MRVIPLDKLPNYIRDCLDAGVTRTSCPQCHGGTSHEESLSIRAAGEGMIKISCWRASCGFYAVSFIDPDARWQFSKLKEGRPLTEDVLPISPDVAAILSNDYGLRPSVYKLHGFGLLSTGQLVMPVRAPTRQTRGHMARTLDGQKRVFAYKATSQPWLDWWTYGDSDKVIVVEDQLSACRLSGLDLTACALLGTNISADEAKEIATTARSRPVYLALDRDAFDKALKLSARHRHILPMIPVCLDTDIKDAQNDADILALFV